MFAKRAYDAVVIVASAGGIRATIAILASLPADLPVPIFIVQHRTLAHPGRLAEVLGRATHLCVQPAVDEDPPAPGTVYVAAPDYRGDALFADAAETFGGRLIGVVLSGPDADGARGVVDIKRAGGFVIAQEKTSAEQFDMPRAAITTGCVDAVLPPDEIGPAIVRLIRGRPVPPTNAS